MGQEIVNIKPLYGQHVPAAGNLGERVKAAGEDLFSGKRDFTGWVELKQDPEEIAAIKKAAAEIQQNSELLVVIGIGGSYLGAKAVLEALTPEKVVGGIGYVPSKGDCCCGKNLEIAFAGCNLSSHYHENILRLVREKETSICVISKSGTTTEPAFAFAVLKDALIEKYGETEAYKRIYAITDKSKGTLREEADANGYTSFIVPDDIGGRYSVLTPVGLLPVAAAGIDIDKLLEGASKIREDIRECLGCKDFVASCQDPKTWCCDTCPHNSECPHNCVQHLKYAVARYALSTADACGSSDRNGCGDSAENGCSGEIASRGEWPKAIEIFEYYEPRLMYFAEWLKQLFGESEGKEGKGIFPASLSFSADLHSMGQFLQEGKQIFFETVLDVQAPGKDLAAPSSATGLIAGHSMNEVERAAVEGVIRAHEKDGVPVIRIPIPELSAFVLGEMICFFEMNCAVTALLSGVDPFNQPGVEAYKAEMKAGLK